MDPTSINMDVDELDLIYEIATFAASAAAANTHSANMLPTDPDAQELELEYELAMFTFGLSANGVGVYSRAFGRGANQTRNQSQPPSRGNTSSPSAYSPSSLGPPNIPPTPASPSLTTAMAANNNAYHENGTKKTPLFFREDYATFIVKGNFMTLAAKPALLEEGEWLAHQSEYPSTSATKPQLMLYYSCRTEPPARWHDQGYYS